MVNTIEYNTVWRYRTEWWGQVVFEPYMEQMIGWHYDKYGVEHVDFYWPEHVPAAGREGEFTVFWLGYDRVLAKNVRWTVSLVDPESCDAERYPAEWRGGLNRWKQLRKVMDGEPLSVRDKYGEQLP